MAAVNTVAPVLSSVPSPIALASVLTVTDGTWTGAASFAVAWLRDGVVIAGQTSHSYTIARDDLGASIIGRVTATPTIGTDPLVNANSNALGPVPGTLVTEDGTGFANAESFASVPWADAYHSRHGNDAWATKSLNLKEIALRKATEYMEQEYRALWDGYRYTVTQALSWPRWEVRMLDQAYGYRWWPSYIGFNTVPDIVRNACCELALRALTVALIVDVGPTKKRVKVGPIETEYTGNLSGNLVYTAVDYMLQPFFGTRSRYTARVIRA